MYWEGGEIAGISNLFSKKCPVFQKKLDEIYVKSDFKMGRRSEIFRYTANKLIRKI